MLWEAARAGLHAPLELAGKREPSWSGTRLYAKRDLNSNTWVEVEVDIADVRREMQAKGLCN